MKLWGSDNNKDGDDVEVSWTVLGGKCVLLSITSRNWRWMYELTSDEAREIASALVDCAKFADEGKR